MQYSPSETPTSRATATGYQPPPCRLILTPEKAQQAVNLHTKMMSREIEKTSDITNITMIKKLEDAIDIIVDAQTTTDATGDQSSSSRACTTATTGSIPPADVDRAVSVSADCAAFVQF